MVAGPSALIALNDHRSEPLQADINCCPNSPHKRIYRLGSTALAYLSTACASYGTIYSIEQALAQEEREDVFQYVFLGSLCGAFTIVGLGVSYLCSHNVYKDCQAPTQYTHLAHLSVQEDDFRYQRDDEKV